MMQAVSPAWMERVRTLPIRIKLLLLSFIVGFSIITILYLSWYRETSIREIYDIRTKIMSMDVMLMDLQRNQNDFVNLLDPRYRREFSTVFEQLVISTESLKEDFGKLNLPVSTLGRLTILTGEYQRLFQVLTVQLSKIGKDQSEGLQRDMVQSIKNIEAGLLRVPNTDNIRLSLHNQLMAMQVFTNNLLLHKQTQFVDHFERNHQKIMNDINNMVPEHSVRQNLRTNLLSYRRTFFDLAEAATIIGLDYQHGLRAEMETTIRESHLTLSRMADEMNIAIRHQERNLNILMGGIAVAFSIAFLVALIFLGRSISTPIRNITNVMTRLADGDLSVDISNKTRQDEIGDMLRALRVFKMGAIIRRRTQEELREAHDELENRVEERTHKLMEEVQDRRRAEAQLMRAREDAEAANRAKSMFLANMSHELRTPLNAIIGYSEILQEDAVDLGYAEITPDLDKINTAGKHLLSIINEILDLSKIEAGRIDIEVTEFEVQDVINTVAEMVRPLVATNNNTLLVEGSQNLGVMKSDLTRLRQILFNFLSNAAKFTDQGKIMLRAFRENDIEGDTIVFSVSDTGIGMSPEQLEMVFAPFAQADTSTTRKYGGTGLGLTVNREIARLMGGEVMGKSSPGKGTTFTVRLPAEILSEMLDDDMENAHV
ncbi:MAG: ATP-binding protein [Magnetovibrio sp.]|nr:ATP-binding protein [Magnetovibrio sp.]